MANCTKCGAPLREGAKFCGACGAKIEVRRFCTECGEELRPGEKFCPQCGTPAEGVSAPQIPAAPARPGETDPSCFEVEGCAGGCRIKKYTGPQAGAVVIPSRIGGKKVVEIGEGAFVNCESLTGVTIPDSVTEIGHSAFLNCKSLTSITIPNGVTKIEFMTFGGCLSLTSITLPAGVTEIDLLAFGPHITIRAPAGSAAERCVKEYKEGLHKLFGTPSKPQPKTSAAPAKLKETDPSYFEVEDRAGGCRIKKYTGPKEGAVVIPSRIGGKKVVEIGDYAFMACQSLTSITIPDSVTEIGDYAFSSCHSLTGITIPNRVTMIGKGAFMVCDSLTGITIPASVTMIGERAFLNCKSLTGITIPGGVTEIGESAFYGCRSLASITIPGSVTKIGRYALELCDSLTRVNIPNSVRKQLSWPDPSDPNAKKIRSSTVTHLSDEPTSAGHSHALWDEWYSKLDEDDHETLRDQGRDPYDPWR